MVLLKFMLVVSLLTWTSAKQNGCEKIVIGDVIYNVTEGDVNFSLHNPANLSEYDLTVTYSWQVNLTSAGNRLDGILYCLFDVDAILQRSRNSSGENEKHEEIDACQSYVGSPFWLTTRNGDHVECDFPCENETRDCNLTPMCSYLNQGCKFLHRDERNVTLPINFGRTYEFALIPYVGGFVDEARLSLSEQKIHLYCGHHLIENVGIPREDAYEFCRTEQTISGSQTAASPPTNLTVYSVYRNFNDITAEIVLRWRAPHDVVRGRNITDYSVYSNGKYKIGKITQEAKSYEGKLDPYYSVTVTEMQFDKLYTFYVGGDSGECPDDMCSSYGDEAILHVQIESNMCEYAANETSYCDSNANCSSKSFPATCTCLPGYSGNGVNTKWKTGSGCHDYDACQSHDLVQEFCHPNAICVDDKPPNQGILDCYCPDGYFGDGKLSGSKCTQTKLVVGIIVSVIVSFSFALLLFISLRRWRNFNRRRERGRYSTFVPGKSSTDIDPLVVTYNHHTSDHSSWNNSLLPNPVFGNQWEINREIITKQEIIGMGNFGVVHKATLTREGIENVVAVKYLSGGFTSERFEDFLAEMSLLISLGNHENVIHVVGVCTTQPSDGHADSVSPLLVTEYMKYGDLLHFLWESREIENRRNDPVYDFTEISLYKIGRQVASGLHFLSQSRVIHGDVAARNILIGENLNCKISDFGLANDVYRYGVIRDATERRVPFKWISPERMMGGRLPITWRSDVWSFGILLYEMATLGSAPYPAMNNLTIFSQLRNGYRMPQPLSCNDYLYSIMKDCWQWEAILRPTFSKLEELLTAAALLSKERHDDEKTPIRIETCDNFDQERYEEDIGRRDATVTPPGVQFNHPHSGTGVVAVHAEDSTEEECLLWSGDITVSLLPNGDVVDKETVTSGKGA